MLSRPFFAIKSDCFSFDLLQVAINHFQTTDMFAHLLIKRSSAKKIAYMYEKTHYNWLLRILIFFLKKQIDITNLSVNIQTHSSNVCSQTASQAHSSCTTCMGMEFLIFINVRIHFHSPTLKNGRYTAFWLSVILSFRPS